MKVLVQWFSMKSKPHKVYFVDFPMKCNINACAGDMQTLYLTLRRFFLCMCCINDIAYKSLEVHSLLTEFETILFTLLMILLSGGFGTNVLFPFPSVINVFIHCKLSLS